MRCVVVDAVGMMGLNRALIYRSTSQVALIDVFSSDRNIANITEMTYSLGELLR